jgi:hypothetical protein
MQNNHQNNTHSIHSADIYKNTHTPIHLSIISISYTTAISNNHC